MKAGQYIKHSLLYLLKLLILVTLLYGLLFLTGNSKVSAEYFVRELFASRQGLLLFIMLVVLAGVYPLFGFVRRTVAADIVEDREKIINAFISEGYSRKEEVEGEKMVFRLSSPFGKLWLMFDDRLTVTVNAEGGITISGIRKKAVQVQFRIESYLMGSGKL